jgi:hypothetical protein
MPGVVAITTFDQGDAFMAIFTIVKRYQVPVYASEIIEAETLFEACTKAVESDDWGEARIDYESAGATHIVLAVLGAYANAYDAPSAVVLRVPREFTEGPMSDDRDSPAGQASEGDQG